ncbi:MAG: F0F1 ATP synthase subunit A [Candidatus Gribaldobacteria bacterium]|nr:F0F1 ATP synthase subunit A [Candidatus Gribaldobacteria bacterium]
MAQEMSITAEPIFQIKDFTVVNSLINSWVAVLVILVIAILIRKKIALIPKGFQNVIEMILEGALNLADSITGLREKTLKFMPLVLPLFFFILVNNFLGILPGVGSIGLIESKDGQSLFVPFFRSGMADLNMTLALAIMVVVATHIVGVVYTGAWKHINKFIPINLILEIPRKIWKEKDFKVLLVNPIQFFVGVVELVGELAKTASLSLRLFGNVFAGEILLGVMASIFAYFTPIPFLFLELFVGLIQALIFSILALVFLNMMSHSHEEAH